MSAYHQPLPGESLVQKANRLLREKGRHDIEWFVAPGGALRLREVVRHQGRLDMDER